MTRQRHVPTVTMAGFVCLGLLCSSTAFGQQNERNRQRSDSNEQQQGAQRAGQTELPQFLQELDLSSEQETQIKQAMRQHNQKLRQTWRQFHTTHARAVELEAAWASAVRDSLSEEDQRKFDQQRLQDREMSRHSGEDASQQRGDAEDRQRDARQRREQRDAEAPDSDAAAPDSPANRQAERRQQREQRQRGQSDSPQASDRSQNAEDQQGITFIVITSASPERFTEGTNQTPQQKQQCEKACQQYKQELTSAWQKLHQLHHELVKIEADRIQAVEEQLTEEQLTKLQESRQEPQPEQESTTSTSTPRQSP